MQSKKRKLLRKISEIKAGSSGRRKKIKKSDKPLGRLTKIKREDTNHQYQEREKM